MLDVRDHYKTTKCATCMISCGCSNGCIRGDDLAEIAELRAALYKTQVGVNHIATYRTDRWPDYGTDHEVALEKLGAGREYDMWCCWNAAMTARDELAQPLI